MMNWLTSVVEQRGDWWLPCVHEIPGANLPGSTGKSVAAICRKLPRSSFQ
jgi:hypothetical protein